MTPTEADFALNLVIDQLTNLAESTRDKHAFQVASATAEKLSMIRSELIETPDSRPSSAPRPAGSAVAR